MKKNLQSRMILSTATGNLPQQLEFFALVNLGLVQSLASGVLTPTEAVERFYHAENCLYVKTHFRKKEANTIMSHGVQLPDIFEALSPEDAQREFCHELETIRALCLKLLNDQRPRGLSDRAVA